MGFQVSKCSGLNGGKVVVMSGTEMVGMYGIVMTRGAMGDAC